MAIEADATASAADVLGWGIRNLVRNGGFDNATLPAANTPHRWSLESTPTVVSDTDVAADAGAYLGETPRSIKITAAGAANEGLKQTLKNLKASTTYTFWCRVKATSGDTASVVTTGATTNLNLSSTSATWTTLEGSFVTDGSGTDVVLKLLAAADTDIVWFDDVLVVEGVARRPRLPNVLDRVVEATDVDNDGTAETYAGLRMLTGIITESTNPTTVTFVSAFEKAPVVVATVVGSVNSRFCTIESVSASQFVVQVRDDAGVDQDEVVHWIAVGP